MAQLENFRLKVFRAVAEHLNFRKAAEQLFLTQPAVTLQIKALESDLGARLFDRAAGRISLTRQGSVLLGYANKVASLISEAKRELGSDDGKVSGDLSLGVSTTSSSMFSLDSSGPSSTSIRSSSSRCIVAIPAKLFVACSKARFPSD